MEEESTKNHIGSAIRELHLLSRREDANNRGITQTIRFRPLEPVGIETACPFPTELQMNLNPRFISKISNIPRKSNVGRCERMRPYFIPERSRTKSENAESSSCPQATAIFPYHALDDDDDDSRSGNARFATTSTTGNHINVINMTSSMMETSCDSNGLGAGAGISFDYNNTGLSGTTNNTTTVTTTSFRKAFPTLKRAKSMEDLGRSSRDVDGSQPSHEMEFVSSRIQKLKF